jgi:hypothetical protein
MFAVKGWQYDQRIETENGLLSLLSWLRSWELLLSLVTQLLLRNGMTRQAPAWRFGYGTPEIGN